MTNNRILRFWRAIFYVKKFFYFPLIEYILPTRCLSCNEMTVTNAGFCLNCWKKIDFITLPYCVICGYPFNITFLSNMQCAKCVHHKPYYDKSRSLIKFNEYSKKIIHEFKYQDTTILSKTFSKLLHRQYYSEFQDIDLIIPVPMNRIKRLFRMYNPALIMAQDIAKLWGKLLYPDGLIKLKWTKSQTFLSKKERAKNLAGSLIFNEKYHIKGKKILLIDDVLTTGATVNKCAKILKDAGAACVYAMTIAMTKY